MIPADLANALNVLMAAEEWLQACDRVRRSDAAGAWDADLKDELIRTRGAFAVELVHLLRGREAT